MAKKGSGAKARNAQKQEPMVALYGLDEGTPRGDAVRSVLRDLGIRVRTIAPEHLGNPVGAIAGMPGMRPARNAFEGQAPRDEFMLVCPMPNALINEMLAAMREANVSIAHKAQVTRSQSPLADARAHGRNRQGARRHDPKRSIGYRAPSIIVRVAT